MVDVNMTVLTLWTATTAYVTLDTCWLWTQRHVKVPCFIDSFNEIDLPTSTLLCSYTYIHFWCKQILTNVLRIPIIVVMDVLTLKDGTIVLVLMVTN